MQKPTSKEFIGLILIVWFAIIAFVVITNEDKTSVLYMKIALVNLCVMFFNMFGVLICSVIDWWPFKDRD